MGRKGKNISDNQSKIQQSLTTQLDMTSWPTMFGEGNKITKKTKREEGDGLVRGGKRGRIAQLKMGGEVQKKLVIEPTGPEYWSPRKRSLRRRVSFGYDRRNKKKSSVGTGGRVNRRGFLDSVPRRKKGGGRTGGG